MPHPIRPLLGCWTALALFAGAAPAWATSLPFVPLADRAACADCIVIGKVKSVEEKTVSALPHPRAASKEEHTVVVVDVEEGLSGAKDVTRIRLGFVPPPPPPPVVGPNGQVFQLPPRVPTPSFAVGQEGLFVLKKHPDQDFFIAAGYFGFTDKKAPNFAKESGLVRRCVKLMADGAGLKSKDAADRDLTAYLLIARYRGGFPGMVGPEKTKTEPVAAEESKLILETLAAADWAGRDQETGASVQGAFFRLGLTDQDGWKPAAGDPAEAARKWLKDNAATYRIQRVVADDKK